MEEVVVSSEGDMELEVKETEAVAQWETEEKKTKKQKKEDSSATSSVVRWERSLPRMVLRVLLVEADDSTRQIIAALLRKCSYKVVAVPDGLKAWEVLKGRPQNIDLILTEVGLPSISGFALLTLIMEHEICKHIPVIMMSSHDSVSTVYKCMLRGAADFLVKPVRKNELSNLWQHVWRRQASIVGGQGPQDESAAQQKVEATAENNAASNHSSGYMDCIKRNRECIEKGSDAQSSCTKPHLGAEGPYMEDMQDLSQAKWSKSLSSDMKIQMHEEGLKESRELPMHDSEAGGPVLAAGKYANRMIREGDMAPDSQREHTNVISEACDNNQILISSSREAIDLIGALDNQPNSCHRSTGLKIGTTKVDLLPLLDLSLRRYQPSSSVNQVMGERQRLNHSDASAFSRYINRAVQPLQSTSGSTCSQQKHYETNSDKPLTNHALNYNSDAHSPTLSSQKNVIALAAGQPGQADITFPCPQQRVFPVPVPVPIPVRGMRFESLCTPYGAVASPIFCSQSGLSPMQSPGSAGHQEPSFQVNSFHPSNPEARVSQKLHNVMDQNTNATDQTEPKEVYRLESLDNRGYFSSVTDQSANSRFCNCAASHLNGVGCESNDIVNPVVRGPMECENDEVFPIQDGNSHRSIQREVALNKFRMKRKDRCYDKKVRYESRKKLAEQRPRVKGQFVRQVHTEALVETGNYYGNLSAGELVVAQIH